MPILKKKKFKNIVKLLGITVIFLITTIMNSFINNKAAHSENIKGYPNVATATSPDNIYHAKDKANRLQIYTSDGKVAEDFAFCINEGKGTPTYDNNSGHSYGTFERLNGSDATTLVNEYKRNHANNGYLGEVTIPNNLSEQQFHEQITKLIYIYQKDRTNILGRSGLESYGETAARNGFWNVIQDWVYYYTEGGGKHPTKYDYPAQNAASQMVGELIKKPIKEIIPDEDLFELRVYKSQPIGGIWTKGVQSIVTGRITTKPAVYFGKQAYKDGITNEEIKDIYTKGQCLAGAKFKILDENGKPLVLGDTTTELSWETNGNLQGVLLNAGTYYLVEEKAPDGYEKEANIKFQVGTDGKVSVQESSTVKVVDNNIIVLDKKTETNNYKVKIKKIGDGNVMISGANLELKKDDGSVVGTWTSDKNFEKEFSLKEGKYVLTEKSAPNGYKKIDKDIEFTVDNQGKIKVTSGNEDVNLTEQDKTLELKNKQVEFIGTYATTKINDVETGKEVTVNNNTTDKITILDRIDYTGFSSGKYVAFASLIKNNDENNVVATAKKDFEVKNNESKGSVTVDLSLQTDKLDKDKSNKFTVLEKVYKAEDVQNGTVQAGKKPVAEHVVKDDQNQTVTIKSIEQSFVFNFWKVDENDKPLKGARLRILDEQGNQVPYQIWNSLEDKFTPITLKAGTYTLNEVVTPNGYYTLTDKKFTVDTKGQLKFENMDGIKIKSEAGVGFEIRVTNKKIVSSLQTTVEADGQSSTAEKSAEVTENKDGVNVVDTIHYKGLIPKQKYEVVGILYEVKDGKLVDPNKPITISNGTGEYTVSDSGEGEWKLNFGKIDGVEARKSYVVYEEVTSVENLVDTDNDGNPDKKHEVEHKDPKDKSQIFVVKPKTPEQKEVQFSKINVGGKEIAGAQIQIKDAQGTVVEKWTSKENETHKVKLSEGTYTFHEEAAPNGYLAVTDITFTVDKDGNVKVTKEDGNTVKAENNKLTVTDQDKYVNPKGELKTTVEADGQSSTTEKSVEVTENKDGVKVVDTIKYKGLVEGKDYTVTGQLYEVKDGKIVGEAKATKTETKKADKDEGNWNLDFGTVKGLEAGKSYVVYETATSLENLVDTDNDNKPDKKQEVEHKDPKDKSQTFVVKPKTPEQKEVQFSKINVGGEEIAGAEIQIKDAQGKIVKEWTSEKGKSKTVKLNPGTYTFHEVTAPKGYLAVTVITFTVDKDGNVKVTNANKNKVEAKGNKLIVTDNLKPVDPPQPPTPEQKEVQFSKINVGGEEIAGAQIEIKQGNKVIKSWISEAGKTRKENLEPGEYTFHEAAAPNGYKKVTNITFTIDKDGKVKVTNVNGNTVKAEGNKLTVTDQKEPVVPPTPQPKEVQFSKVNLGGKEIAGAKIQILKDGKVVESWTSVENKTHKLKLTAGTYTFHEETAPDKYLAVTDITFTVDKDGNVKITNVNGNTVKAEGNKLTVTDKDKPQPEQPKEVQFSKVNLGGKEIAGAKIQILKDGKVVESWTSTNEVHKVKLAEGTYTFHEEAAPEGYLAVTDITFTVDKDGNVKITNVNGNTAKAEGNKLTVTDKDKPKDPMPQKPKSNLPKTGLTDNGMAEVIGGLLLAGAALAYSRRRKG
ncbi:SpaA isopeptide-forming pilin-related protein [Gemella bergeri]